jgi:hypothetical protein
MDDCDIPDKNHDVSYFGEKLTVSLELSGPYTDLMKPSDNIIINLYRVHVCYL